MDTEKAYLSADKEMIQFRYRDKIIRFRGPYSLERFISIKEWDNGYIVVMAKFQHNTELEEEYIDMIPVLRDLSIDWGVINNDDLAEFSDGLKESVDLLLHRLQADG